MKYLFLFCICICLVSCLRCQPSPAPPPSVCYNHGQLPVLYSLRSQCPISFHPNPPLEVSGDDFEKALASKGRTGYTCVLFYASWCPFSRIFRPAFDVLSSMYPQIEHFAVEYYSTMPSLYSRYGIHSFPSILLVNQTSQLRYRGSRDLASLIDFYKQVTGGSKFSFGNVGHEPVKCFVPEQLFSSLATEDGPNLLSWLRTSVMNFYKKRTGHGPVEYFVPQQSSGSLATGGGPIMQSWIGASADDMWRREPYLLLAVFFLLLRIVLHLLRKVLNHFRTIWASYQPHLNLNLEIFGETRQILGRILHLIDVKRVWTKLKLCKSRNFHRGARNAKVWASSLASVSLGKTSTSGQSS